LPTLPHPRFPGQTPVMYLSDFRPVPLPPCSPDGTVPLSVPLPFGHRLPRSASLPCPLVFIYGLFAFEVPGPLLTFLISSGDFCHYRLVRMSRFQLGSTIYLSQITGICPVSPPPTSMRTETRCNPDTTLAPLGVLRGTPPFAGLLINPLPRRTPFPSSR